MVCSSPVSYCATIGLSSVCEAPERLRVTSSPGSEGVPACCDALAGGSCCMSGDPLKEGRGELVLLEPRRRMELGMYRGKGK